MFNKLCLIPFLLFGGTQGCATPDALITPIGFTYKAEEQFKQHVTEFMLSCKRYLGDVQCNTNIDLIVVSAKLNNQTLGLCTTYLSRKRLVEINENIIGQYNEKLVVFHELYHCVLDKPHFDDEVDIMNALEYKETTEFIYEYWPHFVKKAFIRK